MRVTKCDIRRRTGQALIVVAGLWVTLTASAESLPEKGLIDSRIRTAAYSPDEVYRLYGYVGYHIDLEFAPDETFVDLSGGDLEALTFWGHGNILTLKPRAAAAEMNLAVTTTKRRYYFEYTASARRPSRFSDPVMYAVRFVYETRDATKKGPTPAERVEQALVLAGTQRPRNYDYWYCGHRSLKPERTSDDGVHTRLTFGRKAEVPAVFVRNDDGSESLLNFSMDAGDMVVHRVARRLIVRRGKLAGCIVNKGFSGSGERLDSGTVTPAVERERKEPRE